MQTFSGHVIVTHTSHIHMGKMSVATGHMISGDAHQPQLQAPEKGDAPAGWKGTGGGPGKGTD